MTEEKIPVVVFFNGIGSFDLKDWDIYQNWSRAAAAGGLARVDVEGVRRVHVQRLLHRVLLGAGAAGERRRRLMIGQADFWARNTRAARGCASLPRPASPSRPVARLETGC